MAKKKKAAVTRIITAKAGVIHIPSNGLETQKEGWVEMHAYLKTAHLPYFQGLDLRALKKALDEEVSPFDDDYDAAVERKERAWRVIHRLLSIFVLDWNWTYPDGVPYSKPYKNLEAFETIQPDELEWLYERMGEVITEEDVVIPKSKGTPS